MAFGGNDRGGAIADINITPLVDVLLVLLIIFMVTAPQMHEGASVPTPDVTPSDSKSPSKEDKKDTLAVDPQGKITLRGKSISMKELYKSIKTDAKLQKTRELYLNASLDLGYGQIMEIVGTMRKAGIRKLGFVVDATALNLPALPPDPDAPKRRR